MKTINHIDGATSSFLYGKQGEKGYRSRLTFISSYIEGNTLDDFLIEQYRLSGDDYEHNDNRQIEQAVNELTYYYAGNSEYPSYDSSYQNYITEPPIGIHDPSSYIFDVSTYWSLLENSKDSSYGKFDTSYDNFDSSTFRKNDDLFKGNIINSDKITNNSFPLDDDLFVGYKFYEQSQFGTDSSLGYIATIPNSYMSIVVPEFNTTPKIIKRLSEYPEPYDYIIFIDKNITYLLCIEEVEDNNFFEPITCKCKILDTWIKSKNIATYIENTTEITDNIKLYCVNYPVKRVKWINDEIIDPSINMIEPVLKTVKDDTIFKNFLLTSSAGKLGDYKVVIEFFYNCDCVLPVDTIIAKRFIKPKDSDEEVTLIGYPSYYDRMNDLPNNFDDERLDTFEIIVKDFNDGTDSMTFSSTAKFYIPESRQDAYTVNIFIYYKKLNGGYNKFLVNSIPYKEFVNWDDLVNNKYTEKAV